MATLRNYVVYPTEAVSFIHRLQTNFQYNNNKTGQLQTVALSCSSPGLAGSRFLARSLGFICEERHIVSQQAINSLS
jgi:hypothetical protein